jgi:hypothetical protein
MSSFLPMLITLLIVFAVFFVIYRLVRGEKSMKLKSVGWLELLIVYLCVLTPIGIIMGLGKLAPIIEKMPALNFLGTFDILTRIILILISFYAGICLWKISKNAVRKVKIILVILLIFNVLVVKGIYSLVIYAELTNTGVSIPDNTLIDIIMGDVAGSLFYAAIVVSWYIYLIKSRRVKDIYNTPSLPQTVTQQT